MLLSAIATHRHRADLVCSLHVYIPLRTKFLPISADICAYACALITGSWFRRMDRPSTVKKTGLELICLFICCFNLIELLIYPWLQTFGCIQLLSTVVLSCSTTNWSVINACFSMHDSWVLLCDNLYVIRKIKARDDNMFNFRWHSMLGWFPILT
jgi:hypothetical protein